MGIRLLLAPATIAKGEQCINEIRQELKERPLGHPIVYLVPEQMTFQQEYQLLHGDNINGSIRAQVLSFSRLAFRIMQEQGGVTRTFISSTGIQMMLRRIIEQKKTDWEIFQKSVEKKGFIEQLEAMITEFKRYQVTPEMLAAQLENAEQLGNKKQLESKLADLHYLYQALTDVLANQYIDGEDQLALLAEQIPTSNYLTDAIVYVDGFHRFTPQEQAVLSALMKKAAQITFTLTLDKKQVTDQADRFDLFSQTRTTLANLNEMAENNNQALTIDWLEEEGIAPFRKHLADYFDHRPTPVYGEKPPIRIACAVHPRAEIEGIAQEILSYVRDDHYRFRDIAILMRNQDLYLNLIETIFADYGIPVFIDQKKSMLHHPAIELVRSLLEIILTDWRYDAVFRLLKTGLILPSDDRFPLDQDAVDTLENYVIEYGIRGRKQWLGEQDWVVQRFKGFENHLQTDTEREQQAQINAYRKQIITALDKVDTAFRQVKTVKEKAVVLYRWLEQMQVNQQLELMQQTFERNGQVERAREQEQVWQAIGQLLDEMVEIIGAEQISNQLLQQTLEAGLDTLTYAHVPPTIDHVVVGSIDRSRISQVKVALLIGVNEGNWPTKPKVDTVLSELEREQLSEQGIVLADSETQQLIDDWFYIYLAVTLASERIWLSYPLSDTEGRSMVPATLIKRFQDLFPNLADPVMLQDPEELIEADRFITTAGKTLSALTAQLAKYQRSYPIDPVWWSALNWYITKKHTDAQIIPILQSLFYRNDPVSLSEQTVTNLYDKKIQTSVSRMEMYHRCSYQHFAKHDLELAERSTYKLDAPDIGQLFHEALKTITEWVREEQRSFKDLSKQDAYELAERAILRLAPILQHQILHSSNRYQYMKKKLEQIIARATFMLSEQSRKSEFSPVGLEVGFGLANSPIDPVTMQLPNGFELLLRGRIDRVDQAKIADQLYLRIIDYKSSAKGLNLVDVYYGLALQMLTYLDVIISQSEQWLGMRASPAGVLYFHVHDPILSEQQAISQETLEDKLLKKYKMQGLLINNEQVVKKMDTGLETGISPVIPAGFKRDGSFRSGSQVASPEVFTTLQLYARQVIEQAGIAITSGKIKLNPFKQEQQTACQFCTFKSVCQFDPGVPGHQFRKLQPLTDEQVIGKLLDRGKS
ncbi:DNA helicase/exodeoxyribonuclease V, subunit B [Amphibacillus marinus]|uniref:ATP-dependent helicase/deoxyribonuclease subunit B n=1 Tax=Amphibacillus marinus TaxID=872970 RepID=A0A1H8RVA6_9BACI|nr:helicase-exonuclease AddAB subunit AddB [Amphibacillus marinus]SEO70391.1 DNA helicase/exodeoxyribonuclease V, subunit B [Amphibacillus marinus]